MIIFFKESSLKNVRYVCGLCLSRYEKHFNLQSFWHDDVNCEQQFLSSRDFRNPKAKYCKYFIDGLILLLKAQNIQ